MKRILPSALIGALLALGACSSDDNSTPPLLGAFRAINGVVDSNKLGFRINDVAADNDIDFGDDSGLSNPPIGSYPVEITNTTASGTSSQKTVDNVSVSHNVITSLFAYGSVSGHSDFGFATTQPTATPAAGKFNVQPVNAAYGQGPSSTLSFVFTPTSGSATTLTAGFGASPATTALDTGTYRITVKNGAVTLFDSGPTGIALPIPGTNVLQVAALDVPNPSGGAPISLLILDNTGGRTAVFDGTP
jgi:hypothetical protein